MAPKRPPGIKSAVKAERAYGREGRRGVTTSCWGEGGAKRRTKTTTTTTKQKTRKKRGEEAQRALRAPVSQEASAVPTLRRWQRSESTPHRRQPRNKQLRRMRSRAFATRTRVTRHQAVCVRGAVFQASARRAFLMPRRPAEFLKEKSKQEQCQF